jgi:hypothetical protein
MSELVALPSELYRAILELVNPRDCLTLINLSVVSQLLNLEAERILYQDCRWIKSTKKLTRFCHAIEKRNRAVLVENLTVPSFHGSSSKQQGLGNMLRKALALLANLKILEIGDIKCDNFLPLDTVFQLEVFSMARLRLRMAEHVMMFLHTQTRLVSLRLYFKFSTSISQSLDASPFGFPKLRSLFTTDSHLRDFITSCPSLEHLLVIHDQRSDVFSDLPNIQPDFFGRLRTLSVSYQLEDTPDIPRLFHTLHNVEVLRLSIQSRSIVERCSTIIAAAYSLDLWQIPSNQFRHFQLWTDCDVYEWTDRVESTTPVVKGWFGSLPSLQNVEVGTFNLRSKIVLAWERIGGESNEDEKEIGGLRMTKNNGGLAAIMPSFIG